MTCIARRLRGWVLVAGALVTAQEEERNGHQAIAAAGKDFATLQWRRDADGDLEHAVERAKGRFRPLFAGGFPPAIQSAIRSWGLFGKAALLLHGGDVLSLTDGERHLQRLGQGTSTGELLAFAESKLPVELAALAVLDRMVAVDLLVRRADAEATTALERIAAGQAGPEVRARADAGVALLRGKAATARRRIDAATLSLPPSADLHVVIDHEQMPALHALMALSQFMEALTNAMVLDELKAPLPDDYQYAQSHLERVSELPFELARRFGNWRLDQACVSIRLATARTEPAFAVECAGRFDATKATAAAELLRSFGLDQELTGARFRMATAGFARAPAPDLAGRVLDLGGAAVRVHLPPGSRLFASLPLGDAPVPRQAAVAITFGDPVRATATIDMQGAEDAVQYAAAVKALLLRQIKSPLLRAIAVVGAFVDPDALDAFDAFDAPDAPFRVEARGASVHVEIAVPMKSVPSLEETRKFLLQHLQH